MAACFVCKPLNAVIVSVSARLAFVGRFGRRALLAPNRRNACEIRDEMEWGEYQHSAVGEMRTSASNEWLVVTQCSFDGKETNRPWMIRLKRCKWCVARTPKF